MRLKTVSLHSNRGIVAVICVFIALALAYSFADRLKLGPDEPAHFIYIRSLATYFTPPPIAHSETYSESSTSSHEGQQPPLYYAIMAVPYAALNVMGVAQDTIWRVLRLLNILLGVVWIYLVYLFCRAFFEEAENAKSEQPGSRSGFPNPDPTTSLAAAAFVALIPTSSYIAAVVNNDVLIALLFTWALIPLLGFFRSGTMTIKSAAFLGLIIGLAILTKAQGLVLVPMLLLAGLMACARSKYTNASEVARSLGAALGVAVLVSGWWFARCVVLYGTPMPHSLYHPVIRGGMIEMLLFPLNAIGILWKITGLFFSYFLLPYWLVEKHLPSLPYVLALFALMACLLVGLIFRLRRRADVGRRTLYFLTFAPAATYILWVCYVLKIDWGANLQGRLLLPSAAIIGIMVILSLEGWLKSAKARNMILAAGGTLMILANILVLWSTVALRWG